MQNANLTGKSRTLKNTNNLFSYIKMVKEILTFGNIEIEKKKEICYHKTYFFGRFRYRENISI